METPVIVITGAGKGFGRAVAEDICRRIGGPLGRPKLALIGRTAADLDALAATVRAAGLDVFTRELDLTDVEQLPPLVEAIEHELGPIDILLNNAGVGRFGDFLELTLDDVDYVLDTNLRATFVLTQEVFRRMAPRRTGQIVFVTSVAAIQPFEQSAVYCMSKFGQRGLAQVVRLHARKANIRVMEVLPGATLTPMWGDVPAEQASKMMGAEDIARSIVDAISLPARTSLEELVLRPVAGDLSIEVVPVNRLVRLDDGCTLGHLTGDPEATRGLRHEDLGWLASGIAPAEPSALDLFPVLVAAQQEIPPGVGYRTHAHHGLETITIVLAGSYLHELGDDSVLVSAGDVAVVSTGRGATHQETTQPGPALRTIFMWVRSNAPDGAPGFARKAFPDRANRLVTVVSGRGAPGAVPTCAGLDVLAGRFDRGREVSCEVARGYVIPADGAIELAGTVVRAGERALVAGPFTARALEPTEIVVVAA